MLTASGQPSPSTSRRSPASASWGQGTDVGHTRGELVLLDAAMVGLVAVVSGTTGAVAGLACSRGVPLASAARAPKPTIRVAASANKTAHARVATRGRSWPTAARAAAYAGASGCGAAEAALSADVGLGSRIGPPLTGSPAISVNRPDRARADGRREGSGSRARARTARSRSTTWRSAGLVRTFAIVARSVGSFASSAAPMAATSSAVSHSPGDADASPNPTSTTRPSPSSST